ncbi:hypothetical protein HSBAA_29540 [Vreelandella sulfidaeris]|uniref:Uncharacterized protein n=1 Tax=Vreelandella sulfidaeris TaxID=115553 RepID=A0A455UBG7_9GAMM|nr:hypothetical protein HSBAA_29540 [Halomonas sulfidaeris]
MTFRGFLDGLNDWLVGQPQRIEFWGGEPLVYWKKLKLLVPALRERFPDSPVYDDHQWFTSG